jgi:hypothetical protein
VLAGRDPALGPAILVMLLVLGGLVVSAWHGVAYAELGTGRRAPAGSALGLANTAVFIACFHPHADPASAGLAGLAPVWLAAGGAALLPLPLLVPGAPAGSVIVFREARTPSEFVHPLVALGLAHEAGLEAVARQL